MHNICPYCLNSKIIDSCCSNCGENISWIKGVPSNVETVANDKFEKQLEKIIAADSTNIDTVLSDIRKSDFDGSIVDRFFQSRTVNWRILVRSYLSGRGLVIGNHHEKVGILLSEVLDEVHTVDTSPTRLKAQAAVAELRDTRVNPVHADLHTLPFPSTSFDVIVVQCRVGEIDTYLSLLEQYLTEGGVILLLTDGWTREIGITELVGLGDAPNGLYDRVKSLLYGHSIGIHRMVQKSNLTVAQQYALLSTEEYENERLFDITSEEAINWLLNQSPKTATGTSFNTVRTLSRFAQKAGILHQCYPRYLSICKPPAKDQTDPTPETLTESILLSGYARSTLLEFGQNGVKKIRKIPNSHQASELNENTFQVTKRVTGQLSETIPEAERVQTDFGIERHENPVTGTPFDQSLDPTPASVDNHLDIAFDWLSQFQKDNIIRWVKKEPETIETELSIDHIEASTSFSPDRSVEFPTVVVHGDLFGSNIFLQDRKVSHVIDWEFAEFGGNPVTDAGYLLLQTSEFIGDDFKEGFDKLFLTGENYAPKIRSHIIRYCADIGIDPYVFITYLPMCYIKHAKRHLRYGKRLDANFPERIQYIYDNRSTLLNWLTSD